MRYVSFLSNLFLLYGLIESAPLASLIIVRLSL